MPSLLQRLREQLSVERWRSEASRKIAALILTALLLILLLWKLPVWQIAHTPGVTEANRFDREDEARKTLAQIIGGIVILGGLYTSLKTFGLSREGQITDRFTKAIEQLGKTNGDVPNIEVRLGAIYALERIAIDSPRDHWTIMEILTAYVRQNAPIIPGTPFVTGEKPRTDIQAILTVLGRRQTGLQRERPGQRLDLTHVSLNGANLKRANLGNANLRGTDLQEALLEQVNLQGAILNRANLQEALLTEANLQRAGLDHTGLCKANLQDADLSGADLYRADVERANLQKANLQDAFLAEADLHESDLSNADLRRADLVNARLDRTNLDYADLRDAKWLKIEQVQFATNWEYALYSPVFREQLGLPPDTTQN